MIANILSTHGFQRVLMISFRSYGSVYNHMPSFDGTYPGLVELNVDPPVFQISNFLSNSACDALVEAALRDGDCVDTSRTYLMQKTSNEPATEQSNAILSKETRSSTTWYMSVSQVQELCAQVSSLTGRSDATFEEPQIVRYKSGQKYAWHQDAIPSGKANPHAGNRLATIIVYLNTLPEVSIIDDIGCSGSEAQMLKDSGCTSFRDFELTIRPEKGKCIVFFPCFADGTPDHRTAHCSHTVVGKESEKWIAQIWVHQRPYLFWSRSWTMNEYNIWYIMNMHEYTYVWLLVTGTLRVPVGIFCEKNIEVFDNRELYLQVFYSTLVNESNKRTA